MGAVISKTCQDMREYYEYASGPTVGVYIPAGDGGQVAVRGEANGSPVRAPANWGEDPRSPLSPVDGQFERTPIQITVSEDGFNRGHELDSSSVCDYLEGVTAPPATAVIGTPNALYGNRLEPGIHLYDPRSPSDGILRTPIELRENNLSVICGKLWDTKLSLTFNDADDSLVEETVAVAEDQVPGEGQAVNAMDQVVDPKNRLEVVHEDPKSGDSSPALSPIVGSVRVQEKRRTPLGKLQSPAAQLASKITVTTESEKKPEMTSLKKRARKGTPDGVQYSRRNYGKQAILNAIKQQTNSASPGLESRLICSPYEEKENC